jgi:hypothetical protein
MRIVGIIRGERQAEGERMSTQGTLYFVISVDIDPEVEDEFNEWYDTRHLPEVTACPGFVSGRRFRADGDDQSPRYLAVYEVESRDVMKTEALKAIRGFDRFEPHIRNAQRYWFRSAGPVIAH